MVLLSAGLQVVIFPLPNFYLLGWVAFAPLLLALLRGRDPMTLQLRDSMKLEALTPLQGFFLGYVNGVLWYLGTCYWIFETMRRYGGLNLPMAALALLLFAMYLGLYHGLFGLLVCVLADRETYNRRALVASPFLWVAVELARTRVTGFPWNLLGTTQVDNIPLARIATLTGVYGISFEILVVNTALAAAFVVRREKRRPLLAAAAGAIVVLQMGSLLPTPVAATELTARMVQENIPVLAGSDWTKEYFEGTLRDLTWISTQMPKEETAGASAAKPELVLWPESPAPFYTTDPVFREAVSGVARDTGAWVVAGSLGIRNASNSPERLTETYNSAALVSPQGAWTARYDKVHLVPFGEFVPFREVFSFAGGLTKEVGDFSRGTSRAPLDAGGTKLGIFICYESVFPDEIRQFAANGAQVFVNVSNDGWYGDSGAWAQHLKQVRMRAMENQRWVLRATNTGLTSALDPNGRVTASVPRKIRTALDARFALNDATTFYTRHGDWFAYLCAIISAGALALRFVSRNKD